MGEFNYNEYVKNNKLLKEASTKFEFDPKAFPALDIEEKDEYIHGRVVGQSYKYSHSGYPDFRLSIERFKEGKEPNNYIISLWVDDEVLSKDEILSINDKLKIKGTFSSSGGGSNVRYGMFGASAQEAQDAIKIFSTLR